MSENITKQDKNLPRQQIFRKSKELSKNDSIQRTASINPQALTSENVLQLQRSIGNQNVIQLMHNIQSDSLGKASAYPIQRKTVQRETSEKTTYNTHISPFIQRKITVGAAGDCHEQEADRVAQQVMTMDSPMTAEHEPAVQHQAEKKEIQTKPLAASISPLVQRASCGAGFSVTSNFEQQLSSSRGGGSPLSNSVRNFMEPRFGADFSGVRIHTGRQAAQLNRSVSAEAFTHGQDIYMGEGNSDIESAAGKQLLAHELTHVVQQSGDSVKRKVGNTRQAPAGQIQRLVSKEDWIRLAGDVGTVAKLKNSLYTQILETLDEYHTKTTPEEKKKPLRNIVILANRWLTSHTQAVKKKDGYEGEVDSHLKDKQDARKEIFMLGLKEEAEAELKGRPMPEDAPSKYIDEWQKDKEKAEELDQFVKTGSNAAKFKFSIMAAVENEDYLEFAKRRLELTVPNKVKNFFGKGKSGHDIKDQAAQEVVRKKYDKKLTEDQMQNKIDALKNKAEVGHAWVKMGAYDGGNKPVKMDSFGFWPLKYFVNPTMAVPGEVRSPDIAHEGDSNLQQQDFDITEQQYKKGLSRAADLMKSPPDYKLIDYNCTKFVRDVSHAADVPFYEKASIMVPIHGPTWDPNTLYREMEAGGHSYNPTKQKEEQEAAANARLLEQKSKLEAIKFTMTLDPTGDPKNIQIDAWEALEERIKSGNYLVNNGPAGFDVDDIEVSYTGFLGQLMVAKVLDFYEFTSKVEEYYKQYCI